MTIDASGDLIQLKVRLLGISPMIWRRVLVPASSTLRELHGVLQTAMGPNPYWVPVRDIADLGLLPTR
ncbi:MAG: hypothetical protein U1A24_03605 [Cypionkella sp.]|uniref:IS1096 element passenger TnpR family protein n=1 Tax=Cypionkella sp. TaxID=2811411 RepID=UPI002ABC31A9|nr:hypothetical protein [Cypionkella sp.]MDZ4309631.1 hypothetical protein [Cypionkella sp.]